MTQIVIKANEGKYLGRLIKLQAVVEINIKKVKLGNFAKSQIPPPQTWEKVLAGNFMYVEQITNSNASQVC